MMWVLMMLSCWGLMHINEEVASIVLGVVVRDAFAFLVDDCSWVLNGRHD